MSRLTDEIMAGVKVKDALEFYGIQFDSKGFACCPFHGEKTGSFTVYKDNRAKCFGCGWYGSIIDFVKEYFGLNFKEACIKINYDFSLNLLSSRPMTRAEQKERSIEIKLEEARKKFKAQLIQEQLALIDKRRILWRANTRIENPDIAKWVEDLDIEIDLYQERIDSI